MSGLQIEETEGVWLGVKGRYRIVLCCFRWAERNGFVSDLSVTCSGFEVEEPGRTGALQEKNNLKILDFVFLLPKLVLYHLLIYVILTNCLID